MPRNARDSTRGLARALTAACVGFMIVFGSGPARAASLFDPALRFRVVATDHFRIYFHQREERLAARMAAIAEETWQTLRTPLAVVPPRLTHVVLADQTDLTNGFATPVPYDTIVIYTTWPPGSEFATDDWLRLAFTHEFTHIVHLDRSKSWARVVRGVFGRTPIAFPNLFLPTWQIEGLATYEESAITGEGRLHAGDFRAIVDEAARHRALEPLDRVNGRLTDWPGGLAPYAYGLGFHQYLADRFGAQTLATLAEVTARQVPYTASRMFKRVYGRSLGDLWRDYEATLTNAAGNSSSSASEATRLTRHGFVAAAPRFDRHVCAGCPAELHYAVRTPHGFPALNRLTLDGSAPRQMTRRFYGSTTTAGRDDIYFDQLEVHRNVGLYSDLYALSRRTGRSVTLTSGARLRDPDLSPDETTVACVQEQTGRRDLVLFRLNGRTIETVLSEADTQFNAPRWSPDGRQLAVERHRLAVDPEVIVLDVETRTVRVVFAARDTRIVMPAWRPDGKAILAAVAPGDAPFDVFEFAVDETGVSRQLTHLTGGATWPEVSPDGRTLVFVGYTIDGYDLFSMPYPATTPPVGRTLSGPPGGPDKARPTSDEIARPSEKYSPLPTLRPTAWSPIVESDGDQTRIGAATFGRDVLGYHAYTASATWLVSSPSDAVTPRRATPDWVASYAYDRWRVTLFGAASAETSFFDGPPTDQGTPSAATRREREIEAGAIAPFVHTRISHAALVSVVHAANEFTLPGRPGGNITRDRTALRGAWRTATAHTYGYSISPEEGIVAGTTAEIVRRGLGSSANATVLTGDVRGYLRGISRHHVLAARLAGGASIGDAINGRTFVLGGGSPDASVVDFGSGAISLLRGFGSNSFAGSHVVLANVDYRWPIARPQRGLGTWPLFLDTIHGAVFGDAGHAWTRSFDASALKTSAGAELSIDVVAGYFFPFTATAGVGWGRDGSGTLASRATVYFRIGRAF